MVLRIAGVICNLVGVEFGSVPLRTLKHLWISSVIDIERVPVVGVDLS